MKPDPAGFAALPSNAEQEHVLPLISGLGLHPCSFPGHRQAQDDASNHTGPSEAVICSTHSQPPSSSAALPKVNSTMKKDSMERPLRASVDSATAVGTYGHDREKADSDTSSMASLLNDDFEDPNNPMTTLPITPLHVLDDKHSLDPQRWPRRKKIFVAVVIALYTSVFYSGSSIFMVSIPGMIFQYGISQERAMMGLSLYVLSYGLGPLIWAPLTEVRWIGRNPVYIATIIAFVLASFGTALTAKRGMFTFLLLRFLQGFVGSPCLANGGATMHDMFDEQDLPYALGIWIAFAYAGPALGPAIAAEATLVHGWSYPMWFVAVCSVPVCILLLLIPETYLPKILYRKGAYSRIAGEEEHGFDSHGVEHGKDAHSSLNDSVWATLKDSLIKPLQISALDPSVTFVNLYTSFCYATYYTFFDALPITYMNVYGFTLTQVAQACTCIMLGCAVGAACYFAYVYYVSNPRARAGPVAQEERLKPALVAVLLIPIGILIFAHSSKKDIAWPVGMIGIAIYSGAVYIILQCLSIYMLKSYPQYAASLFAANDACRSVLAAGAVHVGIPFYNGLGVVGGCNILAAISALGIIGMYALYWKGASLRARSKFATV